MMIARINSSLIALAGLLLCHPTTLAAQATPGAPDDAPLESRLEAEVRAAVVPIVDSALAQRLPGEPLLDKALEGQTKGASPDRIAAAVRKLVVLLREARSALGSDASPMELSAGASALQAGAGLGALARVRAVRRGESATIPLAVMSELIARGVSPDTAVNAVVVVARRGASDSGLLALRRAVDVDLAAGVPPSVSAAGRAADAATTGLQPEQGTGAPTTPNPPHPPPPRPTRP